MNLGDHPAVAFCMVAEAGILASQALLLAESIRRFGGRYADAPVTVVSPRPGRRPSPDVIHRLRELGADYHALDLVSPTPEYGPSYRVLALGWCARRDGPDVLVQLDSDTVFLDEPDFRLGTHGAAARPVDATGMCSSGPGDPFEPVWLKMCVACGVEIDALGFVESTVDKRRLRTSVNSGLVAAQRGLFILIEEFFRRFAAADIRPFAGTAHGIRAGAATVSAAGFEMWGTSQAAISLALAKSAKTLRILDASANIPLHMLEDIDPMPARAVHLHYHWRFQDADAQTLVADPRLQLPADRREWLRDRLPLAPW